MVVFRQIDCMQVNVVVLGQSGSIREISDVRAKVVVLWQKC